MNVGKKVSMSASIVGRTESSVSKRLSTFVKGTLSGRSQTLEDSWEVGCSYDVSGDKLRVYDTLEMAGTPISTLAKFDEFTLLRVHDGPQVAIGYILPRCAHGPEADTPGWATLEDRRSQEPPAVLKRRVQKKSWTVGGRYEVRHEVTAREAVDLGSPVVGDIYPEEEVLVLDFGVNDAVGAHLPRLRIKVASDRGFVGWITGITTQDDIMLDSLNLLGPQMVQVRKSYRENESKVFALPSLVGRTKSYESSQVKGCRGGSRSWIPSGDYRVLQSTDLKEDPREGSGTIAELVAGMVVTVISLGASKEEGRPMAYVNASQSGDLKGWVFLVSPRGFDIIDTRDLTEFDKVQAWLKQNKGSDNDDTGDDDDDDEYGEEITDSEREQPQRQVRCATKGAAEESDSDQEAVDRNRTSLPKARGGGVDKNRIVAHKKRGKDASPDATDTIHITLDIDRHEAVCAPPAIPPKRRRPSLQDNVLASLIGQPCLAGCFKPMSVGAYGLQP